MAKKASTIPSWAGRHPFAPDRKQPVKFGPGDCLQRLYGAGEHKVLTGTFLSTDKLSCSSFLTPPGGYFEPYDIHAGDEVYYLVNGTGAVFNPLTGRAHTVQAGDMVWIPQGAWHQFYNFGAEQSYVATAFAPKMWTDMGTRVEFSNQPALYQSPGTDWRDLPRIEQAPEPIGRQLGCFPVQGPPARKTQEIYVIRPEQAIQVIHGQNRRMLVSFQVSNDFIHAGVMTMPANFVSDDEVHAGDELILVTAGTISVVIKSPDFDPQSVSVGRFEVRQGERFFVPDGTSHCYVNMHSKPAKAVFFIAPDL